MKADRSKALQHIEVAPTPKLSRQKSQARLYTSAGRQIGRGATGGPAVPNGYTQIAPPALRTDPIHAEAMRIIAKNTPS